MVENNINIVEQMLSTVLVPILHYYYYYYTTNLYYSSERSNGWGYVTVLL